MSGDPSIRKYASKTGIVDSLPLNSSAVGILSEWREQQKVAHTNGLVFPSLVTGDVLNTIKRSFPYRRTRKLARLIKR